jgi:hypothetical protein
MKKHKDGRISYYHQVLGAVIAHPDQTEVIPICPEPILKKDGAQKNDCECNASKRLLEDFRREHPHLKVILCEDALSANGPHLELLNKLNIRFIINVKLDGNKSLFDWVSNYFKLNRTYKCLWMMDKKWGKLDLNQRAAGYESAW